MSLVESETDCRRRGERSFKRKARGDRRVLKA